MAEGRPDSGLDSAVAFLTSLGGARSPSPRAVAWFPAVGAALGVAVGAIWYWSTRAMGTLPGAVVAVVADLLLTGMLHFDGLADTADGLLCQVEAGHRSDEPGGEGGRSGNRAGVVARRLEIMSDPRTGAYGTVAVVVALVARTVAFASVTTTLAGSVVLVGCLWCASRALMAAGLTVMPYARSDGGLASAFTRGQGRRTDFRRGDRLRVRNSWHLAAALGSIGAAAGVLSYWQPRAGGAAALLGTLAGVGVLGLARRRIGGFTGDVLGASGVVLETVGLLAASAHWSAIR